MQIVITNENKVHSYTPFDNWNTIEFPEGYSIVQLEEGKTEQDFLTELGIDHIIIKLTDFSYDGANFILNPAKTPEVVLALQKENKRTNLKSTYLKEILWTDDYFMWHTKKKAKNKTSVEEDALYDDMLTYWNEANEDYERCKTDLITATTKEDVEVVTFEPIFTKTAEEF